MLFFFHAVAHVRTFAVSILHSPFCFWRGILGGVVVCEFCVPSQIFAFVSGFFLNPAAVSHHGNRSLHFAAYILFLTRDSCCLAILEFCSISQIFSFVSGFFLFPAAASHKRTAASILFLARVAVFEFCLQSQILAFVSRFS